jgi:hypothetical protein
MFGPRLSRIFANRWVALWWAASILFLAWQLTPAPDDEASPAAKSASTQPANPWANGKN